jgi:molybdopterin biosynthesis enzyme
VKPHAVVPREVPSERLVGWVLCHDVRDAAGRLVLRKGRVLDPEAAARLAGTATAEVHLVEMEPGDLHEDPAGRRLAAAVAGGGVEVRESSGGQWALLAERRGLLGVRVEALAAVNALDGISVYTLYDSQVVESGEVVARAKVTPLVVAEATVRDAETRCRAAGGLVAVRGFRPLGVAAVAPASLEPGVRARFEAALREKLGWFGARLERLEFVESDPATLARALEAGRASGAGLIVAAGANALDPLDPVFAALERLGGRLVRRGVPAHPGSLLWLASLGPTPVLGMPSCGMFSQATLFDLVLPRLLAGEPVGAAELAAFGHGGLLGRDMAFRFPPYRAGQDRGALPE